MFDPWVRKIPWSKKWQPTPVVLPGKSHGPRSLVGYSPWGPKNQTRLRLNHQLIRQNRAFQHPLPPGYCTVVPDCSRLGMPADEDDCPHVFPVLDVSFRAHSQRGPQVPGERDVPSPQMPPDRPGLPQRVSV